MSISFKTKLLHPLEAKATRSSHAGKAYQEQQRPTSTSQQQQQQKDYSIRKSIGRLVSSLVSSHAAG
jgi:hypothetical protein